METKTNNIFGRISDKVFNDLKSLDDLIIKMGTTKDGYKLSEVGSPSEFKLRFKHFKEHLKKEIPELTEEEILKFDKYYHKFKSVFVWHGAQYFLAALEYELRKKEKI